MVTVDELSKLPLPKMAKLYTVSVNSCGTCYCLHGTCCRLGMVLLLCLLAAPKCKREHYSKKSCKHSCYFEGLCSCLLRYLINRHGSASSTSGTLQLSTRFGDNACLRHSSTRCQRMHACMACRLHVATQKHPHNSILASVLLLPLLSPRHRLCGAGICAKAGGLSVGRRQESKQPHG